MTVVTFEDFTPLPRYDGIPWTTAILQESASESGPWTPIETFVLNPVDPDPSVPLTRNFTTEDATLAAGWYRFIFSDATNDQQQPTDPIQNVPPVDDDSLPTLHDIGAIDRARTVDRDGNELGTFTPATVPTGTEVEVLILQASRDVALRLSGLALPDVFIEDAKSLIAIRTAMLIELSYFAEQVEANLSPYDRWKALYDDGILALQTAIEASTEVGGDVITAGSPAYAFPPTDDPGMIRIQTTW